MSVVRGGYLLLNAGVAHGRWLSTLAALSGAVGECGILLVTSASRLHHVERSWRLSSRYILAFPFNLRLGISKYMPRYLLLHSGTNPSYYSGTALD